MARRCRPLRALPQVMLVSAAIALGTGCRHKPAPVAVAASARSEYSSSSSFCSIASIACAGFQSGPFGEPTGFDR